MTSRLRLAYLVPGLRIGGAELQMLQLTERLPKDRFQVDFLDLIGNGPMDARARDAGLRIRPLGDRALGGTDILTKVTGRARKIAAYVRTARAQHYDIVDAWFYPEDLLAATLRSLTRTPVVISGRRNLTPRPRPRATQRVLEALQNRGCDAIVANSSAAASFAIDHEAADPRKVRIIRNGVELLDPISADARAALRASLGAAEDDVLLGCVANYREVKRHELLIEAFALVAPDRPRLRLVLIGEGPMRPALERQIQGLGVDGRVRLHGSAPDARSLVAAFDVAVQASSSEGLPNALLEAASAGRPVVATAAGGTGEIVEDGVTGLLVPIEDRDALARAIARVADDADLRLRLGGAAREHVSAVFGVNRFVDEWVALYEGLAAMKGIGLSHRQPIASGEAR